MTFDREHFLAFASKLTIPSKEGSDDDEGTHAQLIPFVPLPTQTAFLDEFERGREAGISFFIVQKCRQSGVTTIGLILDLYWCFMCPGIVLPFIADITETTNYNRSLVRDFVESLRSYPEWSYEIRDDNEEIMSFSNRSKILWKVANKRKKGGIGRSVGAACLHGTEIGSWEDEDGARSLMSSLAENNPNSFYLLEGTSSTQEYFRHMCETAMQANNTSERFIFLGWWQHPWYRLYPERSSLHAERFAVYWESTPVLDREEQVWVEGVKRQYHFDIIPEQIAWWRWHLKQRKGGTLDYMYQEYPPLPAYGWRYGTGTFISPTKIIERESIIHSERSLPKKFYRFDPGAGVEFTDSRFIEIDPRLSYYDLVVFEEPEPPHDKLRYAIGVDPTHGVESQSNEAAIEVFRCFTDCTVEVASFSRADTPAYQLAWVILHLAGWYGGRPLLNLELAGGGHETQNEIRRLQMSMAHGYSPVLERAFDQLEHYVYTRLDARRPMSGQSLHYKTTEETKEIMLIAIQHYFERSMMIVRSLALLKQMAAIKWKDRDLEAPRPNDSVMAAALAMMAYKQIIDTDLGGADHCRTDWVKAKRQEQGQSREEFLENMLVDWVDRRIMQQRQIEQAQGQGYSSGQAERELRDYASMRAALAEHKDDIANSMPWQVLNR